jgi:Cupin superfamily protein
VELPSKVPRDLAGLLAPLETRTFLDTCWGRTFQHIPGTPGKFAALLPWATLNSILEQHRLEPPRLRLTREGQAVPASSFLSYRTARKSGQTIPALSPAELTRELREGATLVLDAVDELYPPITDLAEALEKLFCVRVQVNAYAGWRTSHGFDLHWDDHDVFILQVAGRKRWKVYGTTRKYPLARDVESTCAPAEPPLWEGLMQEGDLLYIPRGWWHLANPLDEATLHLTVGVSSATGADVLSWFVDRLRVHEDVRRDLPIFSMEEQRLFVDRLLEIVTGAWHPDLIREFRDYTDARSRARPHLTLPWAASTDVLPPEEILFQVRWSSTRPLAITRDAAGGEIVVLTQGRRWRFAAAAGPILDLLISGRACGVAELQSATDGLSRATVRTFLKELVASGLIFVCESAVPHDR